eukprot:Gb_18211 [translate_table: standard]
MPNAMLETLDTKCGDREFEHPESTPLMTLNVEDILTSSRSWSNELESDPDFESLDSPAGLSSLMNRSNKVLSSGGNMEEKAGFSINDRIGSCIRGLILRERDYIEFSDVASSLARGERVEKEKAAKEEKFIAKNKLGQKTKETELRLGLPEDDDQGFDCCTAVEAFCGLQFSSIADNKCGDREFEHPELTPLMTLNVEDIRTSSRSSRAIPIMRDLILRWEKEGFSIDDGIGSCVGGSILREHDYIDFSNAASSLAHGERKEGHFEKFISIHGSDSKKLSEENKMKSCLERSVQRGMAKPGA